MKKFIKIVKIIFNVISTIIIGVGLVFILLFCIGIQPYVVESGSMEPEIKTGSICFVNKNAKYEDVKVGDIIAFKLSTNEFATHRVCEISDQGFFTKGDANNGRDDIITTKNNFIGKNVFSIPNLGIIIKIIQSPSGKIILGTIIIVLLVAAVLIGTPDKDKKSKE